MIRNLFNLSLGNAIAQAVQWLALLVCTHFYSAEAYGYFYTGISVIGMMGLLSSIQMHQVIVVAKDVAEVEGVFQIGIISNLVGMILSLLLVIFLLWREYIAMDQIYLWSMAWVMFASGVGRIYQGWFVKLGRFSLISKAILIRALSLSALQLALGWLGVKHGLVLGTLLGEVASTVYMGSHPESPALGSVLKIIGLERIIKLLRIYEDFVVGGTLSECVSTVAFGLPVVLFSWRFSATAAGHFSLSHRLIWAPMAMLGFALAQVLYKRLADINPRELYDDKVFKVFWKSIVIALSLAVMIGWLLPNLLKPLMKASWAGAYEYMPPLVGWGIFFLVSAPYRISYRTLRLQKFLLGVHSVFLLWIYFLFLIVAKHLTSIEFCYILGASGISHQIFLIIYMRRRLLCLVNDDYEATK